MEYTSTEIYSDGFGAQYQRIISYYIFSKFNNLIFHYRPFSLMEHNYNNDPNLIKLVSKHINNYVNKLNNETEDEEDEEDEDDKEEDNKEAKILLEQKIQLKVDKFMKHSNDLSKIYLYQKDTKYIIEMNNYMNSLLLY